MTIYDRLSNEELAEIIGEWFAGGQTPTIACCQKNSFVDIIVAFEWNESGIKNKQWFEDPRVNPDWAKKLFHKALIKSGKGKIFPVDEGWVVNPSFDVKDQMIIPVEQDLKYCNNVCHYAKKVFDDIKSSSNPAEPEVRKTVDGVHIHHDMEAWTINWSGGEPHRHKLNTRAVMYQNPEEGYQGARISCLYATREAAIADQKRLTCEICQSQKIHNKNDDLICYSCLHNNE